jgi:CHAT domain-containing protein/tetratricopeptide (TPR) repeat protein
MFPKKHLVATVVTASLYVPPFVLGASGALPIHAQSIEALRAEAEQLFQQSIEQFQRGELQAAFLSASEARQMYRAIGDYEREAFVIMGMGLSFRLVGQFQESIDYYQQSLAIQQDIGDRPGETVSLLGLGAAYIYLGDYQPAIDYYQQALAIEAELNDPKLQSDAFVGLGYAYSHLGAGNYQRSEDYFEQALEIQRKIGDRIGEAVALAGLGLIHVYRGDYQQSIDYYHQSLTLQQDMGDYSPTNIPLGNTESDVLMGLAFNYGYLGDYAQSIIFFKQALDMQLEAGHLEGSARSLTGLGINLWTLGEIKLEAGNLEQADVFLEQAKAFLEQGLGIQQQIGDRRWEAFALYNLGEVKRNLDQHEEAKTYYLQALSIQQDIGDRFGEAWSYNRMGLAYLNLGQPKEAVNQLQQALAIQQDIGDRRGSADTLDKLGRAYMDIQQYESALEANQHAAQVEEELLNLTFDSLPEREKEFFLAQFAERQGSVVALNIQFFPTNAEATRNALEILLQRKGRILDSLSASQQRLRESLTPEDQEVFDALNAARTQYANLTNQRLDNRIPPAEYETQEVEIREYIIVVEQHLARRSPEFQIATESVRLETVQMRLPSDAALVEFFRYQPPDYVEASAEPRYAAYVLRSQGDPRVFDLGRAAEIDALVASYRIGIQRNYRFAEVSSQLYEKLLAPLETAWGEAQHLLISPDAQLNVIPFEALINSDEEYLLNSHQLTYLTSGRDLLRLNNQQQAQHPPIIIASPDYNASTQGVRSSEILHHENHSRASEYTLFDWTPLPGTRAEAEAITAYLEQAHTYLDTEATETRVKQIQSPDILHIATHGFFLSDTETDALENPLLRSGLVFAGVSNRTTQGDDGILTALEVSGLDLRGTQLVVLSACETGLGDVTNGEGVYGLRRAFTLAGAESQVMSLWQVDDNATKDLMVHYYENLQSGLGRGEALRRAQLSLLQNPQYREPRYWAAFILTGDWRSLDRR